MEQNTVDMLPEVMVYAVGASQTEQVASLFTAEAVRYLQKGEALGMVIVEENEIRGGICARTDPENEAVLELLSLYVAPAFRRRKLGSTLFMEMLDNWLAATDGMLGWVELLFSADVSGMKDFLEYVGFELEEEPQAASWQFSVQELPQSPLMQRSIRLPKGCRMHTLQELPRQIRRQMLAELIEHQADQLTEEELQGAEGEISQILTGEQDELLACVIFACQQDSRLCLNQFFTAGTFPAGSLAVLQAAGAAIMAKYPPQTCIEVPALVDSAGNLLQKLVPKAGKIPMIHAVLNLRAVERAEEE